MSNKELPPLPEIVPSARLYKDKAGMKRWDARALASPDDVPVISVSHARTIAYDYARAALAAQPVAQPIRMAQLELLLAKARDCIDTIPGYPKGADICDEIDVMLAAASSPEASKPVQAEAPRWLSVESAMEDPVFQQARAIMGTEYWFQDNALRNALNYVLRAAHSPASGVVERPAFNDPRVQAVYEILCSDEHPDGDEHWEGFAARRIVDALATQPLEQKPVAFVESAAPGAGGFHCRLTGSMPRVGDAVYTSQQPEQVAQDGSTKGGAA